MKSTATIRHTFYMVSEVGWLAFVCNPLPHSISGLLTNGLIGNSNLNSFTRHPFWQQRTIVGRSVHYSTAWMDDNTEGSHPQASPVQIEVGTQRWLPGLTSLSKYIRTWFLNARGSSGATKKKVSPQSNSSPISTVWRTTVPTVTWRTILFKIMLFSKFATQTAIRTAAIRSGVNLKESQENCPTAWSCAGIAANPHEQYQFKGGTVTSADALASLKYPKLHKPTKRLCGPDWKP